MLRTFQKLLTAAAICVATATLATPSFATDKTPAQKKIASQSSADSFQVKMLTSKELKRLSFANKETYFLAIQYMLVTLENYREPGDRPRQYGIMDLFLEKAFGASKIGALCPIGGYWGRWYEKGGGLSCGAPSSDPKDPNFQLWDAKPEDQVPGKGFFCTTSSGERGGSCNSSVFLFGDNGERFCEPLKNLSSNCQKAYVAKYGDPSNPHKDPQQESLKKRDFQKLLTMTKPKVPGGPTLDKSYSDFENQLNNYLIPKRKNFDTGTAKLLMGQIGTMKQVKAAADADPQAPDAEVAGNQETIAPPPPPPGIVIGQPITSPIVGLEQQPNLVGALGDPAIGPMNPVPPVAEAAPPEAAPPAAAPPAQAAPADIDSDNNAVGDPADPGAPPTNVLGKELGCVSDGLKSLGYSPSDRYLAFLGVGVQAFSKGGYDLQNPEARKQFQSKVIAMVQSFGVCDEDAYPKVETKDVAQIQRWLTRDHGDPTSEGVGSEGVDYLYKMTSSRLSGRGTNSDLYEIFGVEKIPAGLSVNTLLHGSDSVAAGVKDIFNFQGWDSKPLADRQKIWTGFEYDARPKKQSNLLSKCIDDSKKLIAKDVAFQVTPVPRTRAPSETHVGENHKVCEAMANACGLNAEFTCAPPAAPAGSIGAPTVPISGSQQSTPGTGAKVQ
jgi:hypothetical protein